MSRWVTIVEPGGRIIGAINLDVHYLIPPHHRRPCVARIMSSVSERIALHDVSMEPIEDKVTLVWHQLEIFTGSSPVNRHEQWFLMTTKNGVPDRAWKSDGWIDLRQGFKASD